MQWIVECAKTPVGDQPPKLPEEVADALADADHPIHDTIDYAYWLEFLEKLKQWRAEANEPDQDASQDTRKE